MPITVAQGRSKRAAPKKYNIPKMNEEELDKFLH